MTQTYSIAITFHICNFGAVRQRKIFVIVLVIGTVLLTTFSFYGYQTLRSPNILVNKEDRVFLIHDDSDFQQVRKDLFEEDIIQDAVSFSFIARLMKYDESVKPGRYLLKKNMSNVQAIRLLRAGIQEPTTITFNNIRLLEELPAAITQGIAATPEEFTTALHSYTDQNDLGFTDTTVLSLFIPNTYEVYWNISPEALIDRMQSEYQSFWNETRLAKAQALGLTPIEVSILASIVQAETKITEESKTIAGLYLNRIDRGYRLQADPTLVFAAGDFTIKRVLNVHKEIESPYNTYKYAGLPPGPINLPEIWALDAVLDYEDHNYLYMCAREDFSGYHRFATNLIDHNRNAELYQRALSIEMRKARIQLN